MAVVEELFESREIGIEANGVIRMTRAFMVYLHDPVEAAYEGPNYGDVYPGQEIYVKTKKAKPHKADGGDACLLTVTYDNQPPLLDVVTWDVNIHTQQEHINAVKKAADRTNYPSPPVGVAVDFTEIGLKSNGEAEGVDIHAPAHSFTATVMRRTSYWTQAYEAQVYSLTRKWNTSTFYGKPAGSVLFMGCRKRDVGPEFIVLTYQFVYERNRDSSDPIVVDTVHGGQQSLAKRGHDYVWFRQGRGRVGGVEGGDVKEGTLSAHVDKVYSSGAYQPLELT